MNWEFAKTKTIKAAKNLNATNIFSTKQQISHALSQNVITSFLLEFSLVQGEKNPDTAETYVAGPTNRTTRQSDTFFLTGSAFLIAYFYTDQYYQTISFKACLLPFTRGRAL